MRRDFADRDDLIAYLREQFPTAVENSPHVSQTQGGRTAAEAQLAQIDPRAYSRTRNHLDGAVTHLSPYIRHGVLTLPEVRAAALARVSDPAQAFKLVQELAWRDYFQRVYAKLGNDIWQDLEPYKTGYTAVDYTPDLPADILAAETGTPLDPFIHQLYETGYLHNHARMWLAAYVVHWRRVRWQAGARWFLTHLLDGDPASNNLSWQWVASTFSHKPYFFNLENLRQYGVPLKGYDTTPFRGSYEALAQTLFPHRE